MENSVWKFVKPCGEQLNSQLECRKIWCLRLWCWYWFFVETICLVEELVKICKDKIWNSLSDPVSSLKHSETYSWWNNPFVRLDWSERLKKKSGNSFISFIEDQAQINLFFLWMNNHFANKIDENYCHIYLHRFKLDFLKFCKMNVRLLQKVFGKNYQTQYSNFLMVQFPPLTLT